MHQKPTNGGSVGIKGNGAELSWSEGGPSCPAAPHVPLVYFPFAALQGSAIITVVISVKLEEAGRKGAVASGCRYRDRC